MTLKLTIFFISINSYSLSLSIFICDIKGKLTFISHKHSTSSSLYPLKLHPSSHKFLLFLIYSFCLSANEMSVPFSEVNV